MNTEELRAAIQTEIDALNKIVEGLTPIVPERVVEWPRDDRHLRSYYWKSPRVKLIYGYHDGGWKIWNPARQKWGVLDKDPGRYGAVNRVTAPFDLAPIRKEDPLLVDSWPENPEDEEVLEKFVWKDRNKNLWRFIGGYWQVWSGEEWILLHTVHSSPEAFLPLTRSEDPEIQEG